MRQKTEQAVQKLMHDMLDNYGSGIRVGQVQLQWIDRPTLVIDAFRDVQAAATDNDFDGFSDSYRCCSRSHPGGRAAQWLQLVDKVGRQRLTRGGPIAYSRAACA